MKRLLIAALVIAGMAVHAQELEWGVKGGLTYNMSDLSLSSAVNTSGEVFTGDRSHNGWHAGLAVRDEITNNFYLQFDALYNQSTFVLEGEDPQGAPIESELVEKSVQLNLSPGIKVFRLLRVQGGLNGNLWLDQDYVDTFGRFHLGYQLGVGVDLGPITFDIGYNSSFNSTSGEWNGIPLTNNRGNLMMSVGLLF